MWRSPVSHDGHSFHFPIPQNLSVRLEEVEANAVVGARRVISKLEARLRDIEAELDEEKRRHAETIKILRKKERTVKEIVIQCEEDQKNILLLQEQLDKATSKVNVYKRQLTEQVSNEVFSILSGNFQQSTRKSKQNTYRSYDHHLGFQKSLLVLNWGYEMNFLDWNRLWDDFF